MMCVCVHGNSIPPPESIWPIISSDRHRPSEAELRAENGSSPALAPSLASSASASAKQSSEGETSGGIKVSLSLFLSL